MLAPWFDRIFNIARGMGTLFENPEDGAARDAEHRQNPSANPKKKGRRVRAMERLKSRRRELRQSREKLRAAKDPAEITKHRHQISRARAEVFRLERELLAAERGRAEDGPVTGALPDFVVLGTQKAGTTYLYHLLTHHPHVETVASKELHFFDNNFELGVEWYRECFPTPEWKDGRLTVTGEATPYYLFHPHAARRMAEVVPGARLIVLLRNPVDRAYSHYQMIARKGVELRTFEEAVEAEVGMLRGETKGALEHEQHAGPGHQLYSYLSRGVYVDQLRRWAEFFDREQMLVLKSEDFFERPAETLEIVLGFLGLQGGVSADKEVFGKRNEGRYERGIDPGTRQRLETLFGPHNERLYEYLGVDLRW